MRGGPAYSNFSWQTLCRAQSLLSGRLDPIVYSTSLDKFPFLHNSRREPPTYCIPLSILVTTDRVWSIFNWHKLLGIYKFCNIHHLETVDIGTSHSAPIAWAPSDPPLVAANSTSAPLECIYTIHHVSSKDSCRRRFDDIPYVTLRDRSNSQSRYSRYLLFAKWHSAFHYISYSALRRSFVPDRKPCSCSPTHRFPVGAPLNLFFFFLFFFLFFSFFFFFIPHIFLASRRVRSRLLEENFPRIGTFLFTFFHFTFFFFFFFVLYEIITYPAPFFGIRSQVGQKIYIQTAFLPCSPFFFFSEFLPPHSHPAWLDKQTYNSRPILRQSYSDKLESFRFHHPIDSAPCSYIHLDYVLSPEPCYSTLPLLRTPCYYIRFISQ